MSGRAHSISLSRIMRRHQQASEASLATARRRSQRFL
jgi:hypothetical protein